MNISSRCWSPFYANECVFFRNEQQKVYYFVSVISESVAEEAGVIPHFHEDPHTTFFGTPHDAGVVKDTERICVVRLPVIQNTSAGLTTLALSFCQVICDVIAGAWVKKF